jgi:hypothetical protein
MADVAVNFAGKVRGWNLTSKPGSPLESAYWIEWDWVGWIRRQIDYAMSLGANCIRLIGDVAMVQNGLITQATYNTRTQQLVAYCVANGLSVLLTGCATYDTGGTDNGTVAMTDAQISNIVISNVGCVTGVSGAPDYRANIIELDIIQEANANMTAARCNNIYSLVKSSVPSIIPCTFSSTLGLKDDAWISTIIASCDCLDYHVYPQTYEISAQPTTTDVTNNPRTTHPTKEILFGEGGADFSAYTSTQVTNWCIGLATLGNMADAKIRGWLSWAVQDQQIASQQYGAFDPNWAPRSNMVLPFIAGSSTSATLLPPKNIRVINNRLIWDPSGCTNAYLSTKLYRDGVQIANPIYCYYDDSANWRGTSHSYTATAMNATTESAASAAFVYPPMQVAQKSVRATMVV